MIKYRYMNIFFKILSIGCLFIFTLINNVYSQYTKWEKNVTYNEINFKKVRFLIETSDTLIVQGVLSGETTINNIPCRRSIVFINDWELKRFILAKDFTVDGIKYPEWTRINYGQKGILLFLGRDMIYQGYCCNGNYEKWYSTGIHTSLYPNGKLKGFFPCKDITIDNIPCKSSPFAGVHLYQNGKLKDCTLSKKHVINGTEYKKNTHLSFDENGKLSKANKYIFWWLKN